MLVTTKLGVNLQHPRLSDAVYAVQNDGNTRAVELSVFEGSTPWDIPPGTTAAVSFKKPDGTSGLYDVLPDGVTRAVTIAGNRITAVFAPQVLTCPGRVDVSVVLYDLGLNRLGLFPFPLFVSKDPSANATPSENYYTLDVAGMYVCSEGEYTPGSAPTIANPDKKTIYLVPQDNEGALYASWAYINGAWEFVETLIVTLDETEGGNGSGNGTGGADLTRYATQEWVRQGYQPKGNYLTKAPVTSVNGKTGAVSLKAADVGAMSRSEANGVILNALDEAKKSGEFNGADGSDGRGIKSIARTSGNGAAGTMDTYTITYTDGTKSTYQVRNGTNGTNGKDGADGIGISGAEINENGELVITYSNNETVNLGRVVGEGSGEAGIPGKDGVGISKTEINSEGHLVITYTDGKTVNLGNVVGAPGADGRDGAQGPQGPAGADGKDGSPGDPGRGIESVVRTAGSGEAGTVDTYTITYTDGTTSTYQVRNGADGKDAPAIETQVWTFTMTDGSVVEMEVAARAVQ